LERVIYQSAVIFYTAIPSLALLNAIFSILKPAAEKNKVIGKMEKVTMQENTR